MSISFTSMALLFLDFLSPLREMTHVRKMSKRNFLRINETIWLYASVLLLIILEASSFMNFLASQNFELMNFVAFQWSRLGMIE